jgi:nucleoside-diphosphate-sugar epimerase
MQKLLITGSAGFIGSQILQNLRKSYLIFIITRDKKKKIKNENVTVVNFRDYNELDRKLKKIKVDVVIHCASHYVKNHTNKDIKKFIDSNILLGNIILENLEQMGVKKFINLSTVWENYNASKDDVFNLYSAYKKCFSILIKYYQKKHFRIKFYNLMISDTFGKLDRRQKIINVIKKNLKKNKVTFVISKNLYLNLLNVTDIVVAIKLILKKNFQSGIYLLKNNKNFSIFQIIQKLNILSKKKARVRWLSTKIIKEKIFKYRILKSWKPKNSSVSQIIDVILN